VLEVPRPNADLIEDTGKCLTKAPKAEFNTQGYSFNSHEVTLQKILACSTAPKVGNNLVWH
jgi:hypothetical protein